MRASKYVGALMAGFVLLGSMTSAETFWVDERQDLPDTDPGDGQALTSSGKTTLRAAIEEANVLPGRDGIYFTGAVAYRSLVMVLLEGPLMIEDDLYINAGGYSRAEIQIRGSSPYRAIEVAEGVSLAMRLVILAQSTAPQDVAIADRGAIILAHPGAMIDMNGGAIRSGRALAMGGGVYLDGASLVLGAGTISGTSDGDGGAVYNRGGTVYVTHGGGISGTAAGRGGGIFNDGGVVHFTNEGSANYFSGTAIEGGALYSKGGIVAFKGVGLNRSSAADGGAIFLVDGAIAEMHGCAFYENTVRGSGGSIYMESGVFRASLCTFGAGAAGRDGGALYVAGGHATLLSCTVTANMADGIGGGAYIGAMGELLMGNTIVADNSGPTAPDLSGNVMSLGHNLIGAGTDAEGLAASDIVGAEDVPVMPMLEHRIQHEGTPDTPQNIYVPLETSPVIDAGDTALLFHEDFVGSACFDARLSCCPRVRGAAVDIGAIEVQQGDDSFTCANGTHSADYNGDQRIGLNELLRVIQLYNSPGFHCESTFEDGYAPGAGAQDCAPHSADYNPPDWDISLGELLRLIQFFNGGGYHACPDAASEDGFCVGAG